MNIKTQRNRQSKRDIPRQSRRQIDKGRHRDRQNKTDKQTKAILKFDEKTVEVIRPIFENGTYWQHSENVLLAALADERQVIRSKAVEQILKIRHDEKTRKMAEEEQSRLKKEKRCTFKRQRIFIKPVPNYNASDYVEFKGESEDFLIYEPPFTKSLTDDQLKLYNKKQLELDISSNSVITKRIIRDMTSVIVKSISPEVRNGMIRMMHQEREKSASQ